MARTNQIDMLHGPLLKKIILFALPLAATSILQQLFNSADIAVVGRFAGSEALAAVGSTSPVIGLFINAFVGLAIGANVRIASLIGQGRRERIPEVVHTAVTIAFISGVIIMMMGLTFAKKILLVMGAPDNVIEAATLYLRIYFLGLPFMTVYNFGASILRGKGDTKRPLYCLLVSGTINVGLNLLLVIVFHMGVAGVAIATVTSNLVNCLLIILFLRREEDEFQFSFGALTLKREHALFILRIGIPAGLQGMVFSFSNVCIQSGINDFGSDVIAGSAAAVNFEFFTYFIVNAFVQTAVTFVGQNYGAGNLKRCQKVYVRCMTLGICATICLNTIFLLGRGVFLQLFTTEAAVMVYGYGRFFHVLAFQPFVNTYEITGGALRGMGKSMLPTILTIFGTCLIRIAWVYVVKYNSLSYEMLLNIYPVSWVLTGTMLITAYFIVRKRNLRQKENR